MEHYRRGFLKYIPEIFLPKYRPVILDEIIVDGKIIGNIVGINLKQVDLYNEGNFNEFIKSVKKIPLIDYKRLYIEDSEDLKKEVQEQIEDELNLRIFNGEETKIKNLNYTLNKIHSILKENLDEKEVLVLCNNKELTKKVVNAISKDVRFITIHGCDGETNEEIYEYILEETGLSIFYTNNIQRIIENYSIIINLIQDLELDLSRIKRNSIIFEFSKNNNFISNKRLFPIEDLGYNIKELGLTETKWLDTKIKTSLYESLFCMEDNKIKYLYGRKSFYTIKDYVNSSLKVKGKL